MSLETAGGANRSKPQAIKMCGAGWTHPFEKE